MTDRPTPWEAHERALRRVDDERQDEHERDCKVVARAKLAALLRDLSEDADLDAVTVADWAHDEVDQWAQAN